MLLVPVLRPPAYGRWDLPTYAPHLDLINDPAITRRYRRVYMRPEADFSSAQEYYDSTEILHAEDVSLAPHELEDGVKLGGRWLFYIVFEMSKPPRNGWEDGGRGKGRDLLMVHGS